MDASHYSCNGYVDLTFRSACREVPEKKCNQKQGYRKEIQEHSISNSNEIKICQFQKFKCARRLRPMDNIPRASIITEESEEELCESNTDEESMHTENENSEAPVAAEHPTRKGNNKKWSIPILKLFRRSKSNSSSSESD